MTGLFARTRRKLAQTISRRLPERYRRDDSGLTTLEWLLIVAAVAGMAALAVVLVTNVISDTSEQVEGQSARRTAAELAAADIEDDAASETWAAGAARADSIANMNAVNQEYEDKCERLRLIYGDVENLMVAWVNGAGAASGTFTDFTTDPQCNVT